MNEGKKKKIGRPKTNNPMINRVMLRFDDETLKKLDIICEREQRTRSNMLRKLIIDYYG